MKEDSGNNVTSPKFKYIKLKIISNKKKYKNKPLGLQQMFDV